MISVLDDMAASIEEFQELLDHEVQQQVDLVKLRDSARHGIPHEIRGDVWKYLLGISSGHEVVLPRLDSPIKSQAPLSDDYDIYLFKRLRGEINRYLRRSRIRDPGVGAVLERVVGSYIMRRSEECPALVYLCGPLAYSLPDEEDVFAAFDGLMFLLDEYYSAKSLKQRVAEFIALFRQELTELYNHFEEEEVDPNEWAIQWFQYFLSRELPVECVVRLWDSYFAEETGLDLHPYVCLAVLKTCKEVLDELERSEIVSFLTRLPAFDMEEIIKEARSIRDDAGITQE